MFTNLVPYFKNEQFYWYDGLTQFFISFIFDGWVMSLFQPLPSFSVYSHGKSLDLSQPHVMGILNVTPDSFSDGGQFNSVNNAVNHCKEMMAAGATIIDIGGESTRPNAKTVTTVDELDRVIPIVKAIRQQCGDKIWLSIDTSSPEVMQAAFNEGADIWNDVRALSREGAAVMAAKLNVPVILMHMRGEPTTMNTLTHYDNVIYDVKAELVSRLNEVINLGLNRENIIIDPGFGFAKNYAHHCALLTELDSLQSLGYPIMFGISRKRFLAEVLTKSGVPAVTETKAIERDAVGTAAGIFALQQGASIIRTHNVAMMQQAVALWQQLVDYKATKTL